MKMYMVGGAVRDEILAVSSKDIDFTVVLEDKDFVINSYVLSDDHDPFVIMVNELQDLGFKIFLETPEYLTVRAQFPKNHGIDTSNIVGGPILFGRENLTADFVLARKESGYTDGRRPDEVIPGTLEDDLARRDFTMNAIAKDEQGNYIDPFNGRKDIEEGYIRTVGKAMDRLTEDALRAVRALRFSVTKQTQSSFLGTDFRRGFVIDVDLRGAMQSDEVLDAIRNNISDERIKDELSKMFRYDTVASIHALNDFPALTAAMFSGSVSLDATMKTKGRGK